MNLAIIPARGGSKRIQKKNIKLFHGKPIISYSILTAISSGLFDRVIVSSDDDHIIDVSKKYGAEVLSKRSKELSDDFTPINEVIRDVLSELGKDAKKYKIGCGSTVIIFNEQGEIDLTAKYDSSLSEGLLVAESIWHNSYFKNNLGINVLTSSQPIGVDGGVPFHDIKVGIKRDSD